MCFKFARTLTASQSRRPQSFDVYSVFHTAGLSEQHSGARRDHHRALHGRDQHHGRELHRSGEERPQLWLVLPQQRDSGGWRPCWGHIDPHGSHRHPLRHRRHADYRGRGSWSHRLQLCGHDLCCCLQGYCHNCYLIYPTINLLMINLVPNISSLCVVEKRGGFLLQCILYIILVWNKQYKLKLS